MNLRNDTSKLTHSREAWQYHNAMDRDIIHAELQTLILASYAISSARTGAWQNK